MSHGKGIADKMESAAKVLQYELQTRTGQPWHCYNAGGHWELGQLESGSRPAGRATVSTYPGTIIVSGWYDKKGGGNISFVYLKLSSRLGSGSIAGAVTAAAIDGAFEKAYEQAVTAFDTEAGRLAEVERIGALTAGIENCGVRVDVTRDRQVTVSFHELTAEQAERLIRAATGLLTPVSA